MFYNHPVEHFSFICMFYALFIVTCWFQGWLPLFSLCWYSVIILYTGSNRCYKLKTCTKLWDCHWSKSSPDLLIQDQKRLDEIKSATLYLLQTHRCIIFAAWDHQHDQYFPDIPVVFDLTCLLPSGGLFMDCMQWWAFEYYIQKWLLWCRDFKVFDREILLNTFLEKSHCKYNFY